MPAHLDHRPALEHENRIGTPNRREPVRDDKRSPVHHQFRQRILDEQLGLGVERRRGLVEHQNRGVLQQRPRNRQALPLAARQPLPALADHRVVSVRQRQDEFVGVRRPCRGRDLLDARIGRSVRDVAGNRVVEQHGVLRDNADLAAQRRELHAPDVDAVDEDLAGADVVEPRQQVDECGLAGAAAPDHGNHLPGVHGE